jgi:hypothetical protein
MFKANADYLLVSPPSREDMQVMAVVEAKLGMNSIFKGLAKKEIKKIVKYRVGILGPLVRDVFVTNDVFIQSKRLLSKNAKKVFAEFDNLGVDQMPNNAKNYIGAFVKAGDFVPSLRRVSLIEDTDDVGDDAGGDEDDEDDQDEFVDGDEDSGDDEEEDDEEEEEEEEEDDFYSIQFLSDYIKKVVALACTKQNYNKWMRSNRFKFDYMIAESIITYGLMAHKRGDIINKKWNYTKWKFYKNVTDITSINLIESPRIPSCSKEVIFNSIYLSANVSELEQKVLYRTSVHNGALYDHLIVVDHIVYVFQSSKLTAKSHSLDYFTIKTVMDKLQFDHNPNFTMIYVYCNDNSTKKQTGCILTNKKPEPITEEAIAAIKTRFKIYIARVCYYPELIEFEIK